MTTVDVIILMAILVFACAIYGFPIWSVHRELRRAEISIRRDRLLERVRWVVGNARQSGRWVHSGMIIRRTPMFPGGPPRAVWKECFRWVAS